MAFIANFRQRDAQTILFMGLMALFPLLTFIHIIVNGSNFPYWDDWDTSFYIARSTLDGTLTLQDIFAQHVDHRNIFTHLVTMFSAYLFRWNIHIELFVLWFLALGNLILFVKITKPKSRFVLLLLTILFFSPRQDWFFSYINCFYFSIFWALVAVYAVQGERGLRNVLIATIVCIFATYSFGSGFLAWGLTGVLLVYKGYSPRTLIPFGVFALLNILFFFSTYTRLSDTDLLRVVNALPLIGSLFVLQSPDLILLSGIVGSMGLILFLIGIYTLYKHKKPILLYLLFAGWIVAIFCSISIGGRFPLMARYTPFGIIFWATTIIVTAQAFPYWRSRLPRYFTVGVFALTLTLYLMLSGQYLPVWWASGAECIKTHLELAPDECLTTVYPDADRLREIIIEMKDARLGFINEL